MYQCVQVLYFVHHLFEMEKKIVHVFNLLLFVVVVSLKYHAILKEEHFVFAGLCKSSWHLYSQPLRAGVTQIRKAGEGRAVTQIISSPWLHEGCEA